MDGWSTGTSGLIVRLRTAEMQSLLLNQKNKWNKVNIMLIKPNLLDHLIFVFLFVFFQLGRRSNINLEQAADGCTETERLPRLIKLFEELEGVFI